MTKVYALTKLYKITVEVTTYQGCFIEISSIIHKQLNNITVTNFDSFLEWIQAKKLGNK